MPGTALILGANGRFGRHASEAFWNAGWRLRIFDRSADTLDEAASGVDVIVNGWNPPYAEWAATVPEMTRAVTAAAERAGATVILPGNVYPFGADAPAVLTADTPHAARNPLGRIRRDMEAAYRSSGVRTILLRAGDFIDTEASGNWFDMVIAAKLERGKLVYPGSMDRLHAWAFLPDVARAAEALARRAETLPRFLDVPFEGYSLTGAQLFDAIDRVTGRRNARRTFAWWQLSLARPVWPMARHLLEMRYLWDMPHRLDGTALSSLLPDHAGTPLDEALRRALGPVARVTANPGRARPCRARSRVPSTT